MYEGSNESKDLLYTSFDSNIHVFYPSVPGHLEFESIDQSKTYVPKEVGGTYSFIWSTSVHNFAIRNVFDPEANQYNTILSRLCHKTFNEISREKLNPPTGGYGRGSYIETDLSCGEGFYAEGKTFRTEEDNKEKIYALFRTMSNQIRICSTFVSDINEHINKARRFCFIDSNNSFLSQNSPAPFSSVCSGDKTDNKRVS